MHPLPKEIKLGGPGCKPCSDGEKTRLDGLTVPIKLFQAIIFTCRRQGIHYFLLAHVRSTGRLSCLIFNFSVTQLSVLR